MTISAENPRWTESATARHDCSRARSRRQGGKPTGAARTERLHRSVRMPYREAGMRRLHSRVLLLLVKLVRLLRQIYAQQRLNRRARSTQHITIKCRMDRKPRCGSRITPWFVSTVRLVVP